MHKCGDKGGKCIIFHSLNSACMYVLETHVLDKVLLQNTGDEGGNTDWCDGLTSFDLRSAVEPEWGRSTGSVQEVSMADRKERHDMTDRQRHREIMPGGVEYVAGPCYNKEEDQKRETVLYNEFFATWSPGENARHVLIPRPCKLMK